MTLYDTDNFLALSGIQHFAFCPRQWALIHIEQQWQDNLLTVQGIQLHERVDNPFFFESRGDLLIARSVPLSSRTLGLFGVSDIIEFHATKKVGISLTEHPGQWYPVPIEYKRGKPKKDDIDAVQLCAQALCLEDMLKISINYGYIFYGETKHRTKVTFEPILREHVKELTEQMHHLFELSITPPAIYTRQKCSKCSLADVCLPSISKSKASLYMKNTLKKM